MRSILPVIWAYLLIFYQLGNCTNAFKGQTAAPKYNVKYYHANIPKNFANRFIDFNDEIEESGSFEVLEIRRKHIPEQYLCFVPKPMAVTNTSTIESPLTSGKEEPKSDAEIIHKAVEEIKKTFTTNDCVFVYGLNGGYWTFAYCFGDKVLQFHENIQHFVTTGDHKPEYPDFVYVLGKFPGNTSKKKFKIENQSSWKKNDLDESEFTLHDSSIISGPMEKNEHSRFIQQTLYDGELCDLTKEPRSIDIIYKCEPNSRNRLEILDLQEIKTCVYQMVINVPRLCILEEFRPDNVEDQIVNIDCKLIDESNAADAGEMNYEDFFSYHEDVPRRDLVFPIPNTYRVSLADYRLLPCGHGFYLGQNKVPLKSPNEYFNYRHILIFNNKFESDYDLIHKISDMLQISIGNKILSPHFEENSQTLLSWTDSFIIWFELYDFYGKFIKLVKIKRDGTQMGTELNLQLVDPETMLDQDGDLVEVARFEAPNKAWNFQAFNKGKYTLRENSMGQISNPDDSTETEVVTVTVTRSLTPESTENAEENYNEKKLIKLLAEKLGLNDVNELHQAIEELDIDIVLEHDEL